MKTDRIHFEAMEARSVDAFPAGHGWQYEPEWDGFRCVLTRDDDVVALYSKSGQDLGRYFPEVVAAALALRENALSSTARLSSQLAENFLLTTFCNASMPLPAG